MTETKAAVEHLDIRVGKVISAKVHFDADSMYIEQIDVNDNHLNSDANDNENVNRTIVSGLRNHLEIEDLIGKYVLVLCNLKPRKLRGILSYGMVLCASNEDHSVVELLTPSTAEGEDNSEIVGQKVNIEGYDMSQPDKMLNPKKKFWEQCEKDFSSNLEGIACYKGIPLLFNGIPFKAKTLTTYHVG